MTAAEFTALIKPAKPAENAAPLYRHLKGLWKSGDDPAQATEALVFFPSEKSRAAARDMVAKDGAYLKIVDEATDRPRCWFNRDWSLGYAVLLPEYAEMKRASRALGLRASLAVDRGDDAEALRDIDRIFRIAEHSGEEPIEIADLVKQSIYTLGCNYLAWWTYMDHGKAVFLDRLNRAIRTHPRLDARLAQLSEPYMLLGFLDDFETDEGRRRVGIKESDIPKLLVVMSAFQNKTLGRTRIVEAARRYQAAFALPPAQRDAAQASALAERDRGLAAFPVAADVYEKLNSGIEDRPTSAIEKNSLAWEQAFTAEARALRHYPVPKSIPTGDLKSPFDGTPLTYSFDGKQIVIQVSRETSFDSGPITRKIPPDTALKLKSK